MNLLEKIEQTTLEHFKYLPEKLGASITRYHGVVLINSGFGTSMFNICFGALENEPSTWAEDIQAIIHHFNGQPFAWWVPVSKRNPALSSLLSNAGLIIEMTECAMLCPLQEYKSTSLKTDIAIRQAITPETLEDFISIIEAYDKKARPFYEALSLNDLTSQEKLFVGYEGNTPVIISVLFEGKGTAAIFSLITDELYRGRGYGTDMMHYLLDAAKRHQMNDVILSASSDSGYRIYKRLGFEQHGLFECFEYQG